MGGFEAPLPADGRTGLGKVSGYIHGFALTLYSHSKLYVDGDEATEDAIADHVFRLAWGDECGPRILRLSAAVDGPTEASPAVMDGLGIGLGDAQRWLGQAGILKGLIRLLREDPRSPYHGVHDPRLASDD